VSPILGTRRDLFFGSGAGRVFASASLSEGKKTYSQDVHRQDKACLLYLIQV
jgi:hypothetical protein